MKKSLRYLLMVSSVLSIHGLTQCILTESINNGLEEIDPKDQEKHDLSGFYCWLGTRFDTFTRRPPRINIDPTPEKLPYKPKSQEEKLALAYRNLAIATKYGAIPKWKSKIEEEKLKQELQDELYWKSLTEREKKIIGQRQIREFERVREEKNKIQEEKYRPLLELEF